MRRLPPLPVFLLLPCLALLPPLLPTLALPPSALADTLPDGSEFRSWEREPAFTRTYHVNRAHPAASDENPGTEELPFRTIGRAAEILEPGERVVVAAGVYHERVSPARGGAGPERIVSYEAAPGARVVIRGSVPLGASWRRSEVPGKESRPGTWQTALGREILADPDDPDDPDYDAFDIENVTEEQFESMSWAAPLRGKPPSTLVRGMVFQEGVRLEQVASYEDLDGREGSFWVDRGERREPTLHVRPHGRVDPRRLLFEVAVRETVFAPREPGLGYIRVKGFTVEHVAGPWPWEQVGAISTNRGHHWIIEGNTVRWSNGVGIDVGSRHPRLPQPETIGFHIVRGNLVTDCGICGICGLGPGGGREFGLLIEENVLLRNAFHDIERLFETGAIKTHNNVRCLIRRNLIVDTLHGPGIWMDWNNQLSRCSENVIIGTRTMHGGIFLEASYLPNLVAQNIVWGTEGRGIYEHDSTGQVFAHNLVGKTSGAAFHLQGQITDRKIDGRPIESGRHIVRGNIVFEAGKEDVFRGAGNEVSGHVTEGVAARLYSELRDLEWSVAGEVEPVDSLPAVRRDFLGAPREGDRAAPGPLAEVPRIPTRMRLWPTAGSGPSSERRPPQPRSSEGPSS